MSVVHVDGCSGVKQFLARWWHRLGGFSIGALGNDKKAWGVQGSMVMVTGDGFVG